MDKSNFGYQLKLWVTVAASISLATPPSVFAQDGKPGKPGKGAVNPSSSHFTPGSVKRVQSSDDDEKLPGDQNKSDEKKPGDKKTDEKKPTDPTAPAKGSDVDPNKKTDPKDGKPGDPTKKPVVADTDKGKDGKDKEKSKDNKEKDKSANQQGQVTPPVKKEGSDQKDTKKDPNDKTIRHVEGQVSPQVEKIEEKPVEKTGKSVRRAGEPTAEEKQKQQEELRKKAEADLKKLEDQKKQQEIEAKAKAEEQKQKADQEKKKVVPADGDSPTEGSQTGKNDLIVDHKKVQDQNKVHNQNKVQDKISDDPNSKVRVDDDHRPLGASEFGKPCEDEALRKIYEYVLKDDSKVLSIMFELTALRLAKRAALQQEETIEQVAKKDVEKLEAQLAKMKDSKPIQEQVQGIYETYGLPSDAKAIDDDMNAMMKRGKDACYWCRNSRLENKHASAYILALSIGEGAASGLSEIDAATVWVVDKLRRQAADKNKKYRYGKELGNLLNVSVRAARYLGKIKGALGLSAGEIQKRIDEHDAVVASVVGGAVESVQKDLKDCITKRNTNCTTGDCVKQDMKSFTDEISKVGFLQRGILQAVAKSDSAKIVKGLKAKMGDVTYDFSNFARDPNAPAPTGPVRYKDGCHKNKH